MDKRPYRNKDLDIDDVDYSYWIDGYEKQHLITEMKDDYLKRVLTTIDTMLQATSDYRLNRPVLHHYTKVVMEELKRRKTI